MSNVAFASDRFRGGSSSASSRIENKKQGHFSVHRSVLNDDWAVDTAKIALWIRLIGMATYRPRSVEFSGRDWFLQPGQLITTPAILGRKLRDQDGKEKSAQAVTRMFKFFAKEGMLTTEGSPFGTIITIKNYAQYQGILGDKPSDKPSDKPKPSNGAGLKVAGDKPSDKPSGKQNKKVVNNTNNKTSLTPQGDDAETKSNSEPPSEKVKKPARVKKQHDPLPAFDRERFKNTWNCKADKHGLPKIRSVTTTTEKGLSRLWSSYLKQCKELGTQAKEIDAFLNGYIEFGYTPTAWACGANPEGKKFGIDTALTQTKIDQILAEDP